MIHVTRYLTALIVLLVLFGTYALAVAPWFEPPPIAKAPVSDLPPAPALLPPESLSELAQYFPPGHWVHDNPKIVKTEQCTLLIQEYKMLPDGRLVLMPCALIFRAAASKAPVIDGKSAAPGRPIILEAPKGAELTFDKPLDPLRAEFGRLEKGTLAGEIVISSPPSTPGGRDALRCTTRAVWLDRQSIRTSNEVEFQYGDSSGKGRILEIALRGEQADPAQKSKSKLGGLHTITLQHLDYLRIASDGRGILNNAIPGGSGAAASQAAPLEVTCQGAFTFDMIKQLARFERQVEVRRLVPGSPPDQLQCEELLLAFAQRKATAAAATTVEDPLAGRLARIIATGAPAVLNAPSSGALATAAYMEYSLADRYVTLKSDKQKQLPQVSLQQFEQHFVAPELHYQIPEQGRLGRLRATGPGELRMADVSGGQRQVITARWEKELQVQPQERSHVVSLLDRASVTLDPLGRFDGNELHLWVQEVPEGGPTVPVGQASPVASNLPETNKSQLTKTTIIPDRLLAIGDVRIFSTQLDVDAGRLEAWFINLPAEAKPIEPLAPPRMIREPVQPAAFSADSVPQASIRNVVRQPTLQKFHVGGAKIQLQAVVRGRTFELESLNIDGQAAIDETRTPEPGQEPIRLRGDLFELHQGTTPAATAHLRGKPAEVSGRGLSLAGSQIDLHRGKNQLLIDGPGEATFPAPVPKSQDAEASSGAAGGLMPLFGSTGTSPTHAEQRQPALPQRMKIVWEQGLVFDGLTARFAGNVQLRSSTQTALAPALEATLSERLDFQAAGGQPRAELAHVLLDGQTTGIYVENQGFDEWGQLISREQMKARSLAIDRLAGKLHVAGPGWVTTVRRGNAAMPGSPSSVAGSLQPVSATNSPNNQQPLTSIHVAFEREIVGDLNRREIEFRQQVLTTYSPANDFGDVIAADPIGKLGPRMMLMQSDLLTITEFVHPPLRWFELRATGHTQVRGEKVDVDAPIVGYSSDKEMLTIQGDGRADAKAWWHQTPGDDPIRYEGQLLRYNLRTGELQNDVLKNLHFPLGPSIKLPFPSP